MSDTLSKFQELVNRIPAPAGALGAHHFNQRNMHPAVEKSSRKLFDGDHYSQATFEAYKHIESRVRKMSKSRKSGKSLMMEVFNEDNPLIILPQSQDADEKDEQEGYKFIFAGAVMAIRNPRGHNPDLVETRDECLDYLSLVSLLLRQLDKAETRK